MRHFRVVLAHPQCCHYFGMHHRWLQVTLDINKQYKWLCCKIIKSLFIKIINQFMKVIIVSILLLIISYIGSTKYFYL